jgi:hypothetical protein
VLEPEPAVGVLDLPVLEQVRPPAAEHEVLGERARPPQVEADRGRGQRRHEEHRRAAQTRRAGRTLVARERALRAAVDHGRGHPPQVGEPAAERGAVEVRGGRADGVR